MIVMFLVSLLAVSAVSASENVTVSSVSADDATEVIELNDDNTVSEYDYDEYQPRIIPEGYSYRQNIPDEINYTTDFDDYFGYYVTVVDEDGYNIEDMEVRLVDADTNEELMKFEYDETEDAYWCSPSAMGVGIHSCKIIVDDYYYNIKPIIFNLKIVKSDVELILKETYVVKGDYAIIKARVTDLEGDSIYEDGRVKFTVNNKNYYRTIDSDGVATLKVKMNKQGTFTYSASYLGDEDHNPSITKKSKIRVLSTSKSARTISIKGYKVVIPLDKYKKLVNAKYNEKTYVFKLNTGKTIKQKVDVINKKTFKSTTKTVKSKVIFFIAYDGSYKYMGSLPPCQYVAELTTSNQHRAGNVICHKWLFGYKQSKEFIKLNSAKVRNSLRDL